jgi:hypothetical protein
MAEYAGYLTTLEKLTPPSTWVEVAQIVDLGGPAAEADQIEVSHRGSRWRRYVAGMVDGGEVAFDVIFDPDHASHDPTVSGSMYDLLETGEVESYRITFPGAGSDTTTATFDAFVSTFEVDSPMEDGIKANLALKITGEITWAHA